MKYIKEVQFPKQLNKNIKKAWFEMCHDYSTSHCVEVLVSGSKGRFIPKSFCDKFEVKNEDGFPLCSDIQCEVYWEEWAEVLEQSNEDLKELVTKHELEVPECASLIIATNDNDGDLELQLLVCEDFWLEHGYCNGCGTVYVSDINRSPCCAEELEREVEF